MGEVADWEGWGSDDQGHHVHVLSTGCTREVAAGRVVGRVLVKYGPKTDPRTWRFWLECVQDGRRVVVAFRVDGGGGLIFL